MGANEKERIGRWTYAVEILAVQQNDQHRYMCIGTWPRIVTVWNLTITLAVCMLDCGIHVGYRCVCICPFTPLSCLASPSPVAQLVDVVPVLRSGDPGTVGCATVLQTGCGWVPQEDGG